MTEKDLLKKINFIKYYQVVGGLIGIVIMAYLFYYVNLTKYFNIMGVISLIFPFIFFGFCIYSGYLLKIKEYYKGLNLVLILLLFQVVAFEIENVYYSVINGFGIKFTINLTKDFILGFDFHPSHFLFQLRNNSGNLILKFNIVAIFFIFYVSNILNETKKINFKK